MLQAACQALLGWPSATRLKTEWMAQIDREKLNYAFGSQGMVIVLVCHQWKAPFRVWCVATLDCQLHFHSFDTERLTYKPTCLPLLSQRDST